MRFQSFAVIFIAIILPISMVLSYYIQMQSDTIALESQYQSRLNNATYAAVSGFQMNSLNTQRIAGESIYSYVEASVNTFHTTLATSMLQSNASKNMFKNYIPAILFTTYDGYYIYSPYKAAVAAVDKKNGQNVLNEKKQVMYMKNGSTQDYRIEHDVADSVSHGTAGSVAYLTEDINDARRDYNYKLKPLIYYSAEYQSGDNYDFVASYTLDNYLSVSGIVNGKNCSKSGYVLNPEDVTIKGDFLIRTSKRSEISGQSLTCKLQNDKANDSILRSSIDDYYEDIVNPEGGEGSSNVKFVRVNVDTDNKTLDSNNVMKQFIWDYSYNANRQAKYGDYYYALVEAKDVTHDSTDDSLLTRYQTGERIINDTIVLQDVFHEKDTEWDSSNILANGGQIHNLEVTYRGHPIEDWDAKKYYIKAYYYSMWVNEQIGENIREENTKQSPQIENDIKTDKQGFYDNLTDSTTVIFKFDGNNDPSSELSSFFLHKTSVIKNSIQSNLNAAISNFNEDRRVDVNDEYIYRMPVLNASDWDNILNNVCMVSFLQGYNRKFNNYSIVKSSNNNTFVTPDSLYFATQIAGNETYSNFPEYHKLDCPYLGNLDTTNEVLFGDRSAEFKYDAKRINSLVSPKYTTDEIIAYVDDETNTYYEKKEININEFPNGLVPIVEGDSTVGDIIDDPSNYSYTAEDGTTDTYNLTDYNQAVTGNVVKYIFDHKNLGCYDCIISGNFDSVVKYYDGELYLTGEIGDTGEILIYYEKEGETAKWLYPNGTEYKGPTTNITILLGNKYPCASVPGELDKRRTALFNNLGKYKETQYKNNKYINL